MNNTHNTSDRLASVIVQLDAIERQESQWHFEQMRLLYEAEAALQTLRLALLAEAEAEASAK
jgi:hypothetical protein